MEVSRNSITPGVPDRAYAINERCSIKMSIPTSQKSHLSVRPQIRIHPSPMEIVYVMARICDYDTALYDDALAYLRLRFSAARIIPARGLWTSSRHWRRAWPSFQRAVGQGVVVSAGWIGPGVARELVDLAACSVPLFWFAGDGLVSGFTVDLVDPTSTTHFGRLRLGSAGLPDLSGALTCWRRDDDFEG